MKAWPPQAEPGKGGGRLGPHQSSRPPATERNGTVGAKGIKLPTFRGVISRRSFCAFERGPPAQLKGACAGGRRKSSGTAGPGPETRPAFRGVAPADRCADAMRLKFTPRRRRRAPREEDGSKAPAICNISNVTSSSPLSRERPHSNSDSGRQSSARQASGEHPPNLPSSRGRAVRGARGSCTLRLRLERGSTVARQSGWERKRQSGWPFGGRGEEMIVAARR